MSDLAEWQAEQEAAHVPAQTKELDADAVALELERACDEWSLSDQERWNRTHALDTVQPTAPQLALLQVQSQVALIHGGVRAGKSEGLVMDSGHFLRGTHPHQTHRPPHVQMFAGRSWSQMVDLLRAWWRYVDPRWFREGIDLSAGSVRGQRSTILTAVDGPGAGSQVRWCTYEQGPKAIQGWTIHRGYLDEPTSEPFYVEARSRVISTRGRLRLGFCPTVKNLGPRMDALDYLWRLVDTGAVEYIHAPLCEESCTPARGLIRIPYLRQVEIDAYAREIPAPLRAMMLGYERTPKRSGQYFDAWGAHLIKDLGVPPGWSVGIGIDHGTRPGKYRISVVLVDRSEFPLCRAHVIRHYKGDGGDENKEARAVIHMLQSIGCTLEDVDFWIGDRIHYGGGKGGIKSNYRLMRALARTQGIDDTRKGWRHKLPFPLQRIWTPKKWDGSPHDNAAVLHGMMVRGGFTIDPACKPLDDDYRSICSMKQTEPGKDGHDSVIYVLIPMLEEDWQRPTQHS